MMRWTIVLIGVIILGLMVPHIFSRGSSEFAYVEPPTGSDIFDFTTYHSYNETVRFLQTISSSYPNITKLVSIGVTFEGRDIWAMKVSDNPGIEEDEPEVFFSGCHHAREWMTTEVCLYTLAFLVDGYSSNSTITDLVDNRQIWFVPVVNPDGRVFDSPGDDPADHSYQPYGWRKNRFDNGDGTFGVDLNRNYDYMWGGVGASRVTDSYTYRGTEPFSENETSAIRDFVGVHDFVFAVNYHSYSQLILYPWGYTFNDTADALVFEQVGRGMSERITNRAGSSYPGYVPQKGSELYYLSGVADDWHYGVHGTFSFCVELYPSLKDFTIQQDPAVSMPYDIFHPRPDKVLPVCQDNLPAALYLMDISDDPYQVLEDRFSVSVGTDRIQMNRSEMRTLNATVTNEGEAERTFDITGGSCPLGFEIGSQPSSLSLVPGESANVAVSIYAGPVAPSGCSDVHIRVTAGEGNMDSSEREYTIRVEVGCRSDVGVGSIDSHADGGTYALGNHTVNSTVRNHGTENISDLDVSMEVLERGPLIYMPVFVDNAESGGNAWSIIDLDGCYSPDTWQLREGEGRSGSSAWWCGSGNAYSANTTQLLVSRPFDLSEVEGANLTFHHRYTTLPLSGFCTVDLYDGRLWTTVASFDGYGPVEFTWYGLNLSEYAGCDDFRFRFRFNSDEKYDTNNGWFIDDILLTVKAYAEVPVHGPEVAQTSGTMQQGECQQLDWNYTFAAAGEYIIRITTLLPTDENRANNVLDINITIVSTLTARKNHGSPDPKPLNVQHHITRSHILRGHCRAL
ncbi:MAG: hypothetical protein AYK23_03600 [Candidatus Proteinoplasmatales archaeon SG8-5]|nr:MAG: hypothetical protein AYK23_03600 [Candidatus Proteinoplasmatales archaeon SG8-5]